MPGLIEKHTMTTRIGLVSDVHSSPIPLGQALDIFRKENVDEIICAGDIA
jgi:predicted phosphodiesterase